MSKQRRKPAKRTGRRSAGGRRIPWFWLGVGAFALALLVGVTLASSRQSTDATPADPAAIEAGAALYAESCAACHGQDLRGTGSGPPFLDAIYAPNHHGDEAFQRAVAAGVVPHHWGFGTMPPVEGLSRDEVAAIVAYVRSVQVEAGVMRDPTHP